MNPLAKLYIFLSLCFPLSSLMAQSAADYQEPYEKGQQALANQDYLAAKGYFEQAIKRMPYYSNLHFGLGKANFGLEKYENARLNFDRAIQLKPYPKNYFLYRAFTYSKLCNYPAARADLEKALDLYPNSPDLESELAQVQALESAYQAPAFASAEPQNPIQNQERNYRRQIRRQILLNTLLPIAVWTGLRLIF